MRQEAPTNQPAFEAGSFQREFFQTDLLSEDFPVAAPGELPADLFPAEELLKVNPEFNTLSRLEVRALAGQRLIETPREVRRVLDPTLRNLHRARWRSHREYTQYLGNAFEILAAYLKAAVLPDQQSEGNRIHLVGLNKGGVVGLLGLRTVFPDATFSVATIDRKLFKVQPGREDEVFVADTGHISEADYGSGDTVFILCDAAPGSGQSAGHIAHRLAQELPNFHAENSIVLSLLAAPAAVDHLLGGHQPRAGRIVTGYLGSGLDSTGLILAPTPGGYRIALDDVERAIDIDWVNAAHKQLTKKQEEYQQSLDTVHALQPFD